LLLHRSGDSSAFFIGYVKFGINAVNVALAASANNRAPAHITITTPSPDS